MFRLSVLVAVFVAVLVVVGCLWVPTSEFHLRVGVDGCCVGLSKWPERSDAFLFHVRAGSVGFEAKTKGFELLEDEYMWSAVNGR